MRMGAELFIPPQARRRRTSPSARSSRGASAARRPPIWPSRCWRASTPATSTGCRSALCSRASSRPSAQHGSLLRAFSTRQSSPRPHRAIRIEGAFKSLPGGLSEMVRALVEAIGGRRIRDEHRGDRDHRRRTVHRADVGRRRRCTAQVVVLATPAYATSALMRDRDEELSRLRGAIPYASAATVALAFTRDRVRHPLTGSGFVVPRAEHTGILAASWLSSKWPNRAPADHVLMRTFVGGARDPEALDRSRRRAGGGIARRRFGRSSAFDGDPLFTRVYRWERSNAQHDVGHLDRVAGDRAGADAASRSVFHRQRLARCRHSRLRRRRSQDGGERGGVAEGR